MSNNMADNSDVRAVAVDVFFDEKHVSDIDLKKTIVTERLQKRDEERLLTLQKNKDIRQEENVESETTDFFSKQFAKARTEVETALEGNDVVDGQITGNILDELAVIVENMQKLLNDKTRFLPPHSVEKSQDAINRLKKAIEDKRLSVMPKKKFAFKTGKKKAAETTDQPPTDTTTVPSKKNIGIEMNDCGLTDKKDEILSKSGEEINKKDIALARLTGCTVKLCGSPNAVHITNLVDCRIFCGPVSGSVFIDDCPNCIFVLACQQLRIHRTTKTNFYIHVTSKAIIEDCSTVTFSPYNWNYDGLDDDYRLSGLDRSKNNWKDVDDFNWLASDAHSPNWSILDESQRIKSWD